MDSPKHSKASMEMARKIAHELVGSLCCGGDPATFSHGSECDEAMAKAAAIIDAGNAPLVELLGLMDGNMQPTAAWLSKRVSDAKQRYEVPK